ncbi:MAG: response regulator [Magnetococcales bacterium]|nr:response regulator [Magnetococcales bacterium]
MITSDLTIKNKISLTILSQQRDEILESWLNNILDESTLVDETELFNLRDNLKKFLYLLETILQEGDMNNTKNSLLDHASRLAKEIAFEHPIQGVAQTGSSVFLFSLREALFPFIKEACGKNLEILVSEMNRVNRVVDRLILIGLETYIKAREKAATEQSRVMVELAESSANAKSLFLASMSHEIRTPIHAILGVGELLSESIINAEQAKLVKIINKSGETLLALINDILDISKIEAGQMNLEVLDFNLSEIIQNTLDILSLQAKDKNLSLILDPSPFPDNIWVSGDQSRIQQILLNLLSNAIKFTDHGKVVVRLEQKNSDTIAFFVSDTGIGIPKEQRQYIFQQFTQADVSISRQYRGTGLGLAICKQLAEKMGGKIEVDSEVGVGSVFKLILPLQIITPTKYSSHDSLNKKAKVENANSKCVSKKLNILLAEDAEDNVILFQAFLNSSGHNIYIAENGAEALRKFQKEKYDIVFMDMEMPVMDGCTSTRAMRSWEQENGLHPTPIIALSANAMHEHKKKSLKAGCDLHLSKPISKAKLLEYIDQFKETK